MSKEIVEIRGAKVFAGPGMWAFHAEAHVCDVQGNDVYVHVSEYDGMSEYTVSEKSVYAFMVENKGEPADGFLEEYTSLKASAASEYAKVFKTLRGLVTQMGKGI